MRIVIITDAWHPQINGVVRTLTQTIAMLKQFGHEIEVISPDRFRNFPCPTYPEIRLSWLPHRSLSKMIRTFQPNAVHIATEGPLGWAARRYCLREKLPFSSAYHTRFAEYTQARFNIPLSWSYAFLRKFHAVAENVMVPTQTIRQDLIQRDFNNTALWGRGVDNTRFYPSERDALNQYLSADFSAPKFVNIGRVAVEKNIEAFLSLELPGHKFVIGDGPARAQLEKQYPAVHFLGAFPQEALPPFYNAADVFVFPSKTDTFGLVLLEAMACGTPVAAYPVAGPIDVVTDTTAGILHQDLQQACLQALTLKRSNAAAFGAKHSWEAVSRQFEALLVPF